MWRSIADGFTVLTMHKTKKPVKAPLFAPKISVVETLHATSLQSNNLKYTQ
jgi:hypothetical protein